MGQLPVVILRANDISFLGLIRSIGEISSTDIYPVVFYWKDNPTWHGEKSKFFSNITIIENPATDANVALKQMINLGKELKSKYGRKAIVLCSSDVNLFFFIKYETHLSEYFSLPGDRKLSNFSAKLADKSNVTKIFKKNLSHFNPITDYISNLDEISKLKRWDIFPCIIKPAEKDFTQSFYRENNSLKAIMCNDMSELEKYTRQFLSKKHKLIIQEYLEFDSSTDEIPTYTYFDGNGNLRIYANGIKKIIFPEKFGTAIALELSYESELIKYAEKVGKELEWFGPLMIEFVKDKKNFEYKILEINTRPWLFHNFYNQCGLPFVKMFVENILELNNDDFKINLPKQDVIGNCNIDLLNMAKLFNIEKKYSNLSKSKITNKFIDFCSVCDQKNLFFAHGQQDDNGPLVSVIQEISSNYNFDYNDLKKNFVLDS